MNDVLNAKGIKKSYNGREILSGVDLSVKRGEFLSIMGESGSGKTTFLSILGGNLKPDSGEVTLDGVSVSSATDSELALLRRTKLGFVFQSLNLIPTLNAADNILLPIYLHRADICEAREKMLSLAQTLKISHLLSSFPEDMSGGEAQRVAIARAMIHDPLVLMLDEPTGNLDSANAHTLLEMLTDLNSTHSLTVLQVTHSTRAASYGSRTLGMCDGRLYDL